MRTRVYPESLGGNGCIDQLLFGWDVVVVFNRIVIISILSRYFPFLIPFLLYLPADRRAGGQQLRLQMSSRAEMIDVVLLHPKRGLTG